MNLINFNVSQLSARTYPEDKKIEIYKEQIKSLDDFNLTILHEFIHAQDFEFDNLNESGILDSRSYELFTEQRARFIYLNFPGLIDRIKESYPILK